MRLTTFNIWGHYGPNPRRRWELAAEALKDLQTDILCLQEAFDAEALDELAEKLNLRIHCHTAEGGLAVLSRLDCRPGTVMPYQSQSSKENLKRFFAFCECIAGNRRFTVYTTHLSWKKEDADARREQMKELLREAEKNKDFILCGDFNCLFESEEMNVLRKNGIIDSMHGFPDKDKPTWDNRNPFIASHFAKFDDRRVDLILTGKNTGFADPVKSFIALKEVQNGEMHASDHYAVVADWSGS